MRDVIAGLCVVCYGLYFLLVGIGYGLGSLARMETGYYPVLIASIVVAIGIFITVSGFFRRFDSEKVAVNLKMVRPFVFVQAGIASFALLIETVGLIPSVFAAVVLSALGDRKNTFLSTLLLAAVVSVLIYIVFILGLGISVPAFKGVD